MEEELEACSMGGAAVVSAFGEGKGGGRMGRGFRRSAGGVRIE